uniref:N-acetyltransferase domain-containing protein n=1 Tax=Clastoptera arizonana TaxID=38151 RepID=A0A1B6CMK8_9HEMI
MTSLYQDPSLQDTESLEVLPIHHHEQFFEPCCKLINSEWKRSDTARMWSLKASCDQFPTSLVLVYKKCEVVGHARMTLIPSLVSACFIESVVIDTNHRRKGWGKYLMFKTEEYALCQNIISLYLATKGQEEFYRKLGYSECPSVSIYGSPPLCPQKPNIISSYIAPPAPPMPSLLPKTNINQFSKPKKTYMKKDIILI